MKKSICIALLSLAIVFSLSVSPPYTVYATEQTDNVKSIIFLLDTSGSMKTNDSDRLAIDSIAQLIYTLPSDYRVGFVAYGTDITAEQEPVECELRSELMGKAESVEYKGYSNAGAGLGRAVDFLINDTAQEKYIVMLSDGEILMGDDESTQESSMLYQDAVAQAVKEEITIHVIGLGKEMEDMNNSIFAAGSTGGQSYHAAQAVNIQDAIDSILDKELAVKRSTIAIVETNGGTENVEVEIPYVHADELRVLLTGSSPIRNLNAVFQSESARQFNGERYSLIEIKNPLDSRVELSFEGTPGSQVKITVIPEYHVNASVEIVYMDSVPESIEGYDPTEAIDTFHMINTTDPITVNYERTARIIYTFCRADNSNIQLWNTEYFDHNNIIATVNGEPVELALNAGKLETEEKVTASCEYEVSFDYSKLPVNVIGTETVHVELEGPPPLPVKEPEPPYLLMGIVIVGAILLVVVIMIFILYLRRPKPAPMPAEERPEPGKYSYVGKLNLYLTRTRSGYDIPPLSYNLFRLPPGRVVSLREILDECEVEEELPGAEYIYFKADSNRTLILTNNSDCTIMKNREILMKKKSYVLQLDSKVDVSFEDEISELTFQYKDLKSSEMW